MPASEVSQNVSQEEKIQFDKAIARDKSKTVRSPWHREGSDEPPVSRPRQAGAMVKGKLLTTPTRLFKLILPLTLQDHNDDRKDAQPLALLVHPSQPLSYLERLIQSELPLLKIKDREKIPDVNFRAEDVVTDDTNEGESRHKEKAEDLEEHHDEGEKHGTSSPPESFVRWSKSTEIGDFVRDAASGKEFSVEIEGAPKEIMVAVPGFNDRTYYLRLRLRKKAEQIANMTDLKKECDLAAHRYSQRVAYAGFGGLSAWGGIVAWLTFMTSYGWDTMEPINKSFSIQFLLSLLTFRTGKPFPPL